MAIGVVLFTAGCVGVAHAQGGPPMISDDPGTPGPGNWEINIAATEAHHASSSEGELPLLDINYGVGERIQLKYEVPWITQREDGRSRSGLGNSVVGVKWRFYDAGEQGWQVSTYPQVELRNPGSHSSDRGLSESGTGVLLPFELQREFATFGLNFEAGREIRSQGDGSWFGGVVLGHSFTAHTELMAELHGDWSPSVNESAVVANLGGRFALSESGTLLVSIGRDLRNHFEDRAMMFGYVGWQITH